MNFLCSTFGSAGDLFPKLGLALELRRRGHNVTFATNEHYGDVVQRHGLPFEPIGDEKLFQQCIQNPEIWSPRRGFRHLIETLQPVLKRQYELHETFHRSQGGVAITNVFGFGALMAQEKLGLPVITQHLQPAVIWSDREPPLMPNLFGPRWMKSIQYRIGVRFYLDPAICPFLNSWRAELGLPPIRNIVKWWNSPFGVLCLFPSWYAAPQSDWPAFVMQADFPLWNDQTRQASEPDLESLLEPGNPPLVFTPGSANIHGKAFFTAAVETCQSLGRSGILLTEFPEQLPTSLPQNVRHIRYVPLEKLLPRAAAFIHHGGVGSMSQAMAVGIPQILMPMAHDQFDNAQRVKKLGIGDAISAPRFTGARLASRLKRLLSSPAVATACQAISKRLAARDGILKAADLVEARIRLFEQKTA